MLFREKDNPERRFDYLDEIIGTIGNGMLGLTVNCARCHNHKFDPIAQKDYYALQASIFGYVETEVPLAPRAEAEAYLAKNEEIDGKLEALASRDRGASRSRIATRLRARADQERSSREHIFTARRRSPRADRTPGEQLLATQVLPKPSNVAAARDREA